MPLLSIIHEVQTEGHQSESQFSPDLSSLISLGCAEYAAITSLLRNKL